MPTRARKEEYFAKLEKLLDAHTQVFLVHADNVGSKQLQHIRIALRGVAQVVMGKNTMMRRCISNWLIKNPENEIAKLLPHIIGNVGFIFCTGHLAEARKVILQHVVPAPCKAGVLANCDVWVPAGPTGCDPSQTSYFQALNVATKISKGQIEIVSDIKVCNVGERVYDNGSLFSPAVLDITDDDLVYKFCQGVRNIAAVSLVVGYPTLASIPHSLTNAVMQCVALLHGAGSTYSFEKAELALAALPKPAAAEEPAAEEAAAEEE
eukprot:GSMAST32.ASY1.ANO1.1221.1 assembled CDS